MEDAEKLEISLFVQILLTPAEGNAKYAYKETLLKSSFANPENKRTGFESSIYKSYK